MASAKSRPIGAVPILIAAVLIVVISMIIAERKEKASILIAIAENGEIWIDKRPVDVRAVRANIERLRAENPQGAVVVQADKNSKNGLLVKVMDAAALGWCRERISGRGDSELR